MKRECDATNLALCGVDHSTQINIVIYRRRRLLMSFINLEMQNGASNYGRILEWVSLLKVQITFSF